MNVTFAVLAYNEMKPIRLDGQRLLRSLSAARVHPGIAEVLIVDDGSSDYVPLQRFAQNNFPEVKLYHNATNLGVFLNKIEIIAQSTGDWVITCDSDNFKDTAYIDKALSLPLDPDVWYCPGRAHAELDYSQFAGEYNLQTISKFDEGGYVKRNLGRCCLNTGNQMVHRNTFMDVFGKYRGTQYWLDFWRVYWDVPHEERVSHDWRQVVDANDSFLLNALWLYAGKRLMVVPDLHYDHYMAKGDESNFNRSGWQKGPVGDVYAQELWEASEKTKHQP